MNQVVNAKRRYLRDAYARLNDAYETWMKHQAPGDRAAWDIDLIDRLIEEANALKKAIEQASTDGLPQNDWQQPKQPPDETD